MADLKLVFLDGPRREMTGIVPKRGWLTWKTVKALMMSHGSRLVLRGTFDPRVIEAHAVTHLVGDRRHIDARAVGDKRTRRRR